MNEFVMDEIEAYTEVFEKLKIGETHEWDSIGFSLTYHKENYFSLNLFITDQSQLDKIFGSDQAEKVVGRFPNCLRFLSSRNVAEFLVLNILPIFVGVDSDGGMILE